MKPWSRACMLLFGIFTSSQAWSAPPLDVLANSTAGSARSPALPEKFSAFNATNSAASPTPRPIRLAAEPYFSAAVQPSRTIRFINGDHLTAEILFQDGDSLELRLFGQSHLRVPLSTIDRICSLPGDRQRVNHHFDANATVADEDLVVQMVAPGIQRILLPRTSGDYRCWFRHRPMAATQEASEGSNFTWRFDDGSRLQVRVDASRQWRAEMTSKKTGSTTSQSIPARFCSQIFRLQQVGERLFLTLDNNLLWAGPAPEGRLESLEFLAGDAAAKPEWSFPIEHISLVETRPEQFDWPTTLQDRDTVLGTAGEIWWGELKAIGSAGVEWSDGQSLWQRGWRDFGGIQRSPAAHPFPSRPLTGCVVGIELQPLADRPELSAGGLAAVLGGSESGWLWVEHPLWGRLAIPHSAIRTLDMRFTGDWVILDAREVSLGNRLDNPRNIEQSAPIRIEGNFNLISPLADSAVFSLEQSGLEPSGPQTPPGSPTLRDLQRGDLATELHLNEIRVAKLNDLTSTWTLPGEFQRLKLRLPRNVLRAGLNTWRIEQNPPAGSHGRRDDCTLRMLSLELSTTFLSLREE